MDITKDGVREEDTYIESYCSSDDGEGVINISNQKHQSSCKQAARPSRENSPPLLLALSVTGGRALQNRSPRPASSAAFLQEEEDCEQPVEDWMILGGEEQEGDSSIQLNLGCWSSSEDESGVEGPVVKTCTDTWAVSEKDKFGANQSLTSRYFLPGRDVICHICNRTGHGAKSCYYHKKCPTCILCGIKGHIHRDCPSRPCPSCGLPSHGLRPCEKPPVWNQLCRRCGITGHLSDTCPDTWRQYHMTIQIEVPLRPQTAHTVKHKRCFAHCYNCSKRGHYGFECTKRRMVCGTFPSLPYVCHYDTTADILHYCTRTQNETKEHVGLGSMHSSDQHHSARPSGEIGQNQPIQRKSRTKQETCSRAAKRKTWPERRRERQQVKKLRREAQARRQGGLLERSHSNSDDEAYHIDPFKLPCCGHCQATPPPHKRNEVGGIKSRKSKEAERWKRRGGMKRGELYPHSDVDIGSENLLSPKQRVRHRRR